MTSSFSIYTVLGLLISILLPAAMLIWWKRKHSTLGLWPFIVGAICYVVFTKLLYPTITEAVEIIFAFCGVYYSSSSLSPILSTLLSALTVAIFEESWRLFALYFLLSRRNTPDVAVAYGIGSGGMKIVIVFGLSLGMYIAQGSGLFTSFIEAISYLAANIGLSMLVFKAANDRKKFCLYPMAILLHALLTFSSNCMNSSVLLSLYENGDITAFYNLMSISSVGSIVLAAVVSAGILYLGIRALYGKKDENIEQENESDDYQ